MSEPGVSGKSDYPLVLLAGLMNKATRDELLYGAARQMRSSNVGIHQAIRSGLQNRIHGGFRDPLRAPIQMLVQELDRFLFRDPIITRDLVRLWAQSVEGLETSIQQFVETTSSDERLARLLDTPTDEWSAEEFLQLADACPTKPSGLDKTAIAVVIADSVWHKRRRKQLNDESEPDDREDESVCNTDEARNEKETAPTFEATDQRLSGDDLIRALERLLGTSAAALRTPRLAQLIGEFRDLPWDANEWEELPQFMAALLEARARAVEGGKALYSESPSGCAR
jgi:hypothetical protein